jgi:hypothetical protein
MRHLCVGYVRRALMTFAAKLIFIDSQQPGEARLVGIMAGNASASQHGLVHRRHSQPFVHLIMALGAERLVIVHGEAGVIRTVRNVTAHAVSILEWRVNHCRTFAAGPIVTSQTKLAGIHCKEMRAYDAVSLMAVQAILTGGRVA